jgi:hypothetical protein
VGGPACGQARCAGENAVTFLCWGECRRASGERASGAGMRCGRGTLDGPSALSSKMRSVSLIRLPGPPGPPTASEAILKVAPADVVRQKTVRASVPEGHAVVD